MAAPLSGDGPLPDVVAVTKDTPFQQNIGFNETTGNQQPQPQQNISSSPPPPQNTGGTKPQIEVNPTIQIVLIALAIVVGLLFLFGILAAFYIAHKNKKARQHQEALEREEAERQQHRQFSLKKKHIAINTILDRKGASFQHHDNNNNYSSDGQDGGEREKNVFGGYETVALGSVADREGDGNAQRESDGCNDHADNGAGPRRESFLTLSPDGFGITLWPDTSTPSLASAKGIQPSGVELGTTQTPSTETAALYSKEIGSQSQQGGRDESTNNNNISDGSSSNHRTASSDLLRRGVAPCPSGGTHGIPSNYPTKIGQNTKNSLTEVAQIYAHRQSLIDPLGLQTLAAVPTALPPSSGDRGSAFPSSSSPHVPHPPSSSSSQPLPVATDWQQTSSSQFYDSLTLSKGTTLSRRDTDHDDTNTNEASTVYETAISMPTDTYDQPKKEESEEDDDCGAGVGAMFSLGRNSPDQQPPQQQQQESKPNEEPEEAIIYPKVVPRRKKTYNSALNDHQQQQRHKDLAAYRQTIMVPNTISSSFAEISYQPPSQPTSPTTETFDRSAWKAGLSSRRNQETVGSGGVGGSNSVGVGVGVGVGMGVGMGLSDGGDSHLSKSGAVVVDIENSAQDGEEELVMPQVVPRRPRTATFPHRPINYRHSVHMRHESRPSLNISMGRRSMYGFGDLMSMSSSAEQHYQQQPPLQQQHQSSQPMHQQAPPPRPEPFTVSRSKTVYDATAHLQTSSSVSATTQRLRRKWAGGEMTIETTVPTHSGIGSSVGSIHSMRRKNERSFADDDYDDMASSSVSFHSRHRTHQPRKSFDRYTEDGRSGERAYRNGGSGVGGSSSGIGSNDQEHVVVSLPSPRGCLLEDDQHNAEKQFYEMMNFLQGQGDQSGGMGSKGHARRQSFRNPYQLQPFPQHHQRFQSYTPNKRQSYYPPSHYQQQKQTYSYERTSFDRSFPHPSQSCYQNSSTQNHRMSYVEDYYRAQQHQQQQQPQQQQQQQPASSTRRDAGRRAQNAFKRLSAVFGGGSTQTSDDERQTGGSTAAGLSSSNARGVGNPEDDSSNGQRYREGGSRRRGLLSVEEKIKRHSIAVMNDQMFFGRANQESFPSGADSHERYEQSVHQQQQHQQQRHQPSSSSSMSHRLPQRHYRQESGFSSNNYRNDKNRRATMYGAMSSLSGRYSSDLVRHADYLVESPRDERDGYDLGVGVGGDEDYDYEGAEEDEEPAGEGDYYEEQDAEMQGEEEEDGNGGEYYYEEENEEDFERGDDSHPADEEHGYHEDGPKVEPMKQMLREPGGGRARRAQSSRGESVTVGALSSSSALDEEGGKPAKQPLKKIMKIFK
ncbi:hypothetical protein BGW41_006864 [Actinomortierella wolfii]|nr:hypothetical protein BGW41_006864 [Actinomortierella wolfii]